MKLIVGLGNPGKDYIHTRHNIGFDVVDALAHSFMFSSGKTKFKADILEGTIANTKVLALKPQTFMNLSGSSVGEAVRFYKISLEDIIVIQDDIDLELGKLKIKRGGGAGGHNGITSIDSHIGKDYTRLRFGVGHPGQKKQVSSFVLKRFASEQQVVVDQVIDAIVKHFPTLIGNDRETFLTQCAHTLNPPTHTPKPKPKED